MLAAILTLCGTMSLVSCTSEEDNSVEPEKSGQNTEVSKYTIAQIESEVQGLSVDPVMFVFTDLLRLYDLDKDGTCNVYELSLNEEGEEKKEEVDEILYSGSWKVNNDISRLHFVDKIDIEGYEIMGSLILQTKMQFDEADEIVALITGNEEPLVIERKDTLAILRDQEDGELFFINSDDVDFLVTLEETGLFSEDSLAQTRSISVTRAMYYSELNKRINEITKGETYRTLAGPMMEGKADLSGWMGVFYKELNPRLCDLSIIGADNAPTGYLPDVMNPRLPNVKTQFLTIEELWNKGVRYFDLGVCFYTEGAELRFYDYRAKKANVYINFREALEKLKALVESHPSETAIIFLDQPEDASIDYQPAIRQMYTDLQAVLGDRLLTNFGSDIRLNNCRGKILLMNRFSKQVDDCPMGLNIYEAWPDNSSITEEHKEFTFPNASKGIVYVQGYKQNRYGKISTDLKKSYVLQGFRMAAESGKSSSPQWYINYVAGYTKTLDYVNYSLNAFEQNGNAISNIDVAGKKSGIVVIDFVGKDGCGVSKHIKFDCKGALLPMLVTSKNFYAVRDRAIMLDDAYQEDPYIDDYDDYDY